MFIPELISTEIENIETVFAYQGGVSVMPETIKYLDQREEYEVKWLETLKKSDVPTTLIWGEKDPVAVPAVADHVWENYLRDRKAPATYWRIHAQATIFRMINLNWLCNWCVLQLGKRQSLICQNVLVNQNKFNKS